LKTYLKLVLFGGSGSGRLLSEESQKPTAKFLLLVATWFREKYCFFLEEASQNRALKMRSAQRYTARGKRNTQKLEKQSGFVRH